MLSALVLQLVQSVAKIPAPVEHDQRQAVIDGKTDVKNVEELPILSSLDISYQISKMFLTIFLDKISSKKGNGYFLVFQINKSSNFQYEFLDKLSHN